MQICRGLTGAPWNELGKCLAPNEAGGGDENARPCNLTEAFEF
jgi:hypothetical protein